MWKKCLVLFIIILFVGSGFITYVGGTIIKKHSCSTIAHNGQTIYGTLMHDGQKREYILYIPDSYTGDEPVPLVFNFHGYTSSAESQMNYADFRPIADNNCFLVVHPQGTLDDLGNAYWNVGGFWHSGGDSDDVGFTSALIEVIAKNYSVSMTKIYATGMSNGGYFSFHLAGLLSPKITAVAPVAGTMTPYTYDNCDPQHPTPILQTHGTADFIVPYNGNTWSKSVQAVLNYWVDYNNCNPVPTVTPLPDIDPNDGSTVTHYVYSEGDNDVNVEHFKVIGGGHTWPGSDFEGNQDIDACSEIWKFFSRYSLGTIYVDDDAHSSWYDGTHVRTIQEGIDNASSGDTVFVYNGTYYENVVAYMNLNIIGEDKNSAIIDGGGSGNVVFVTSDGVNISKLTIKNGDVGIKLDDSDSNIIINNTLGSNNNYGIEINNELSNNNLIFHNNFVKNNNNALDLGVNSWDNGYPSGGNFWDDYTGVDNDGDGIGDTPYSISGGDNVDRYPLMEPTGSVPPNTPTIEGPNRGKPNTVYDFSFKATDPNKDPVMYYIDWGDSNTEWTEYTNSGEEIILKHSWEEDGPYLIRAKAKDTSGHESLWGTHEITIPRNRAINTPFLNFLNNLKNMFPTFRHFLGI